MLEKETGRLLGAHLIGEHADEVINVFALALQNELTARDIKKTLLAYPTAGFDVKYML